MSISPDTLRPETLAELEANLEQMKTANYFLRVAADQVPEALLIIEAESASPRGRACFSATLRRPSSSESSPSAACAA